MLAEISPLSGSKNGGQVLYPSLHYRNGGVEIETRVHFLAIFANYQLAERHAFFISFFDHKSPLYLYPRVYSKIRKNQLDQARVLFRDLAVGEKHARDLVAGESVVAAPHAGNPPYGALLNYYLRNKPAENERVVVSVEDAQGKKIQEFAGAREAGINGVAWDLCSDPPAGLTAEAQQSRRGGRGSMVDPGTYTVKVAVGQKQVSKPVLVEEDPRITISAADRSVRREAIGLDIRNGPFSTWCFSIISTGS